MPPFELDNYEILDELGRGGMAVVYRARDRRLGREVALKLLHEQVANELEYRERFEREAKAAAKLSHRNVLTVYDYTGPETARGYIITELIDGPTLREFVDETGFEEPSVVALLGIALGEALEHAHVNGVIHRDVKPENVMIDSKGVPRLTDFGLARLLGGSKLTMTGALLGSPAHMAPEIIEGEPSDERSDLFSLGTTLYFAVTSRLPFDGSNPAVVLNAILKGRYTRPEDVVPTIDEDFARIINRLLEVDPNDRFSSAAEVVSALKGLLSRYGFGDPHNELKAFFESPEQKNQQTREAQQEYWKKLAYEALTEGRKAIAIRASNRLFAWNPQDEAAAAVLKDIAGMERTRAIMRAVASLIIMLLVAIFAARWVTTAPEPEEEPAPVDHGELYDSASRQVDEAVERASVRGDLAAERLAHNRAVSGAIEQALSGFGAAVAQAFARQREVELLRSQTSAGQTPPPRPRVENISAVDATSEPDPPDTEGMTDITQLAEAVTAEVRFRVWPMTAEVALDGARLGSAQTLMESGARVAVGRRAFTATVEGLDTTAEAVVDISADRPNTVTLEVPWPPARVIVQSQTSAMVLLDGHPAGRTRQSITVPITGRGTTRRVNVRVIKEGEFGPPWEDDVTVRTGEELVVRVPF